MPLTRIILFIAFSFGLSFSSRLSFAAQVIKVDREQRRIQLSLNRLEKRDIKVKSRILIEEPSTKTELNALVLAIKGQKILVKISKKDQIPESFGKEGSIQIRRKEITLAKDTKEKTDVDVAKSENEVVPKKEPQVPPTAQEAVATKADSSPVTTPVPISSMIPKETNESARTGKMISVDAEFGATVMPVPSAGGTIGYYLNPKNALELHYSRGKSLLDAKQIESGLLEIQPTVTTDIASFRIKNFLGDSFYANAGAGIRHIQIVGFPTQAVDDFPIDNGPLFSKRHVDLIFDFGLGNKWQFSSFHIGADWVGLLAPLSKIRLPEDGEKTAYDPQDLAAVYPAYSQAGQDAVNPDLYFSRPNTTFYSKFYVGFSF